MEVSRWLARSTIDREVVGSSPALAAGCRSKREPVAVCTLQGLWAHSTLHAFCVGK